MNHLFCLFLGLAAATEAAKTNENYIASPADLKARIPAQLHITKPDFVVFVPQVAGNAVNDTGNEHFPRLRRARTASLMAVWTQSSAESQPDQHIAFSAELRRGCHVVQTADHCRAKAARRRSHGELGLPAGQHVRPHLRPLQPAHRQVRLVLPSHRLAARHLQRRQRSDLVAAAKRPRRPQPQRQPRRRHAAEHALLAEAAAARQGRQVSRRLHPLDQLCGAEASHQILDLRRLACRVHAFRERGRQSRAAQTQDQLVRRQ